MGLGAKDSFKQRGVRLGGLRSPEESLKNYRLRYGHFQFTLKIWNNLFGGTYRALMSDTG